MLLLATSWPKKSCMNNIINLNTITKASLTSAVDLNDIHYITDNDQTTCFFILQNKSRMFVHFLTSFYHELTITIEGSDLACEGDSIIIYRETCTTDQSCLLYKKCFIIDHTQTKCRYSCTCAATYCDYAQILFFNNHGNDTSKMKVCEIYNWRSLHNKDYFQGNHSYSLLEYMGQ